MQVFAHDLDVGALARQVLLRELRHLVAVRVVLVQQVHLLDVGLVLDEGGQRFHLHRRVGVEAEMPVAALAVGEVGVDRGVVEVDDLLAGVALVVLVDGVDDGRRHRRAVALDDVAHALVDGRLQCVQRLGGAQLVVDAGDLELHARRVAGRPHVELLGEELVALELVAAHRGHQPRQGVDAHHLHRLAGQRLGARLGLAHRDAAGHQQRTADEQRDLHVRELHLRVSWPCVSVAFNSTGIGRAGRQG